MKEGITVCTTHSDRTIRGAALLILGIALSIIYLPARRQLMPRRGRRPSCWAAALQPGGDASCGQRLYGHRR